MEQVLPPNTANGAGFEATRVRQFTVFLENRVGRLMALLRALEEEQQFLHALAIEEAADAALVRIIVSDPERAKPALKKRGFSLSVTEVLCVELPAVDNPLNVVCQALLTAELNMHYTYPMLKGLSGPAVVVYVDDVTFASQLMLRRNFRMLSEADLAQKTTGGNEY